MNLKITLFLALAFSLYSCSECEESVLLGEFNLTEISKGFIPYTGTETLVFIDNNDVEHKLTSRSNRTLEQTRLVVRTTCDGGFLDRTDMFFNIERDQIDYIDSLGLQVFYVDLFAMFEDRNDLDSIAIYEKLYVTASIGGNFIGNINIITNELQNEVSETHRNDFVDHSRLIGDTTLYNREFTEVFVDITDEGRGVYYNKERGVVAFKLSEEEFWVLKE